MTAKLIRPRVCKVNLDKEKMKMQTGKNFIAGREWPAWRPPSIAHSTLRALSTVWTTGFYNLLFFTSLWNAFFRIRPVDYLPETETNKKQGESKKIQSVSSLANVVDELFVQTNNWRYPKLKKYIEFFRVWSRSHLQLLLKGLVWTHKHNKNRCFE